MTPEIDWSKQPNGIHQAPFSEVLRLMPDLAGPLADFPEIPDMFTWDVKVHMLMPRQYPCIPNWHVDNVPRDRDGRQEFDHIQPHLPMYLWLSGSPLTEFRTGYVRAQTWVRFTQQDEHRGTASDGFKWRCFIRASHKNILPPKSGPWLRRHTQVYLDENTYKW